ncbi:putative tat pathway signal sequence protein [Eutypa lata UCREL1]|uniref:Putative tat pathway signal sequence protein n=1 Tax=Eutypa lata (strain UCR-EL1) TaxID=1287681 RepID=M7T508_EUTLA|nr:putative tat pathway signal sequence protein [Eutypa lata UCREL1]
MLEKTTTLAYSRVSDDESSQSATESDGFIYGGYQAKKTSRREKILIALVGFSVFVAYSALLTTATSMWWKKERLHGANVVDTPIRPYIKYEPTFFDHTETSKDYKLVGKPSEELDKNWSNIMQYFYAEIPVEYMEKLGRTKDGIQLPNGNYLANYAFIHQLHCLKRLHQSYFQDHYFPNLTEDEKELQLEHNLHCLQMLIEGIMCKADETPLTMIWFNESILPGGNRTIAHECVNWELLLEGMEKNKVDPFTPGLLVHPKFGPVVPDGRQTVLDNRIGYVKFATPLDRDQWP